MSDFLSNLAARSLNKAKVVRPRLASLFEPHNSLYIRPATEYLQSEYLIKDIREEAVSENKSDEVSPERRSTEIKHSSWSFGQLPRHKIKTGPENVEQHVLRPNGVETTHEPASEGPFVVQEKINDQLQAPSANADVTEISIPKNNRHRPKLEPAFQGDTPERSMSYDEVRLYLKAVGSHSEISRQKAIEFAASPQVSERISAGVFRELQQIVQPVVRSDRSETANINVRPMHPLRIHYSEPESPHQTRSLSVPSPTIEVTIGRVEVRATSSASQPRVQSQKSPKMSLEEYLHHRSKGG